MTTQPPEPAMPELPELPKPGRVLSEPPAFYKDEWKHYGFFTSGQMRAYAAEAVRAALSERAVPQQIEEAASRLITAVLDQCSGYTHGPGFDAAQHARYLRATITLHNAGLLAAAPALPAVEAQPAPRVAVALSEEQILMIGRRALDKCLGTDAQHIYIAREVERHYLTPPTEPSKGSL